MKRVMSAQVMYDAIAAMRNNNSIELHEHARKLEEQAQIQLQYELMDIMSSIQFNTEIEKQNKEFFYVITFDADKEFSGQIYLSNDYIPQACEYDNTDKLVLKDNKVMLEVAKEYDGNNFKYETVELDALDNTNPFESPYKVVNADNVKARYSAVTRTYYLLIMGNYKFINSCKWALH